MSPGKIKILMIDDDEEDFRIIEQIIEEITPSQYSIQWTPSFTTGLQWITRKEHDVYLVDYHLGEKTGLEVIKEAIDMGCEAPLIILTGANDFEIDKQALEAGAADYLLKGTFTGQVMERAVRYALANARQRREMRKMNAELEERVKNRTITLEQTLAELKKYQHELIEAKNKAEHAALKAEEASKSKTHFLSNMSHEIRTPMNSILGFTKLALNTNLNKKQKEYLNAIKTSGDILIVLINDILDLAKVEAGKMTFIPAPFSLSTCVSEVLQLFYSKVNGTSLKLEKEYDSAIPEVLLGDRIRLEQIILNLLSNAIKFTEKGEIKVRVQLMKEDEESATVKFSVMDTGIGIAEEKLRTIFDEFEQATTKTSTIYGGTGLGLSIAKQFVELQGGGISVESKVNEGSVFSFILRFQKTNESVKINETRLPAFQPETKNVRILVVEDESLNQLLIETIMEQFGFSMDVAKDGKMATDMLREKEYDVILMDLHMPVMDGFEATAYIRSKINHDIPIIALTADVTTIDIDRCKAIGMNDYVSKPIDDQLLYATIIKYIDNPLPVLGERRRKIIREYKQLINFDYLDTLTDGNAQGKTRLIKTYLEEVPKLLEVMRQSISSSDWNGLHRAAHSMIPCFSIVGLNKEYEECARKIENYAITKNGRVEITGLFQKIEKICNETCEELKREYKGS